MSLLDDYIKKTVQPTIEEFERDISPRRAFLTAVVIFHAVDRAAVDQGMRTSGNLRNEWGKSSAAFKIVDVVAHRFKHVRSGDEGQPRRLDEGKKQWGDLTYGHALARMTMHEFSVTLKSAIRFVEEQAATRR
jgi:hypothetical protein